MPLGKEAFSVIATAVTAIRCPAPARPTNSHGRRIVVVHGLAAPAFTVTPVRCALTEHGFDAHTFAYASPSPRGTIERFAAELDRYCDSLQPDVLVGHSLGGILAYLVAGSRNLAAVTLGSPFNGANLARIVPSGVGRQLRLNPAGLQCLAEHPAPAHHIAIASNTDSLVTVESATACGDERLVLDGIPHTALTSHPRAVAATVAATRRCTATHDE